MPFCREGVGRNFTQRRTLYETGHFTFTFTTNNKGVGPTLTGTPEGTDTISTSLPTFTTDPTGLGTYRCPYLKGLSNTNLCLVIVLYQKKILFGD